LSPLLLLLPLPLLLLPTVAPLLLRKRLST